MVAEMEAKESPYAIANEVLGAGVTEVRMHIEWGIRTRGIVDCRLYTARG